MFSVQCTTPARGHPLLREDQRGGEHQRRILNPCRFDLALSLIVLGFLVITLIFWMEIYPVKVQKLPSLTLLISVLEDKIKIIFPCGRT